MSSSFAEGTEKKYIEIKGEREKERDDDDDKMEICRISSDTND